VLSHNPDLLAYLLCLALVYFDFQNLKNVKQLLSNTAYTGLSHFTAAIFQIALQIFVVRSTSTKEFGEYTTALALENMLTLRLDYVQSLIERFNSFFSSI